VSTALMLVWYLRYTESPILRRRIGLGRTLSSTCAPAGWRTSTRAGC
jgi:hypothetical protein